MKTSPNILFIMADQMAALLLPLPRSAPESCACSPSRLAERAVVFDSAYCNSSLCAPSQPPLVSGRLFTRIGAWGNAADFAADNPTYAHYPRNLGYRTASGKMHFCGPDQVCTRNADQHIYPVTTGAVNWDEPEVRPSWYHNMPPRFCRPVPACAPTSWTSTRRWCSKARQYLYDHVL